MVDMLSVDDTARSLNISKRKLNAYVDALELKTYRGEDKKPYLYAGDIQAIQAFRSSSEKANPLYAGAIAYSDNPTAITSPRTYKTYAREGYGGEATVFKAVKYIIQNAAAIPPVLFADKSIDKKKTIETHPLLDKLEMPNNEETGFAYREAALGYLLIAGNSYQYAIRKGIKGPPDELWTLQPDKVQPLAAKTRGIAGFKYEEFDEKQNPILPENIGWLKFWNPEDPRVGLSPLQVGGILVDMQTAARKWDLSLLQNSGKLSGAWTTEATLNANDRKMLESRLNEKFAGPRGAGKFPLLDGGFKWNQMGANPTDLDWLEGIKYNASVLATLYDIAPQLIGDTSSTTYNNMKEAKAASYTEAIFPLLDRLYALWRNWLVLMYPDLRGTYLYYDKTTVEVVQEIIQDKEDAKNKRANQSYQMSTAMLDEAREMQGLSPLPNGQGKVFKIGTILVPAEKLMEFAEKSTTPPPAPIVPELPGPANDAPTDGQSNPTQDDQSQEKRYVKAKDDTEEQTGIMVAFFLDKASAKKLAVAGGEPASDLHITLAYLGETTDVYLDVPALQEALKTFAREQSPLSGRIAGIGRFDAPGGGPVPIIALPDIPGLPEFRHSLTELLEEQGYPANNEHGYTPHITLAYINADDDAPISDVPHFDITLDKLWLAVGGDRYSFPIGQEEKTRNGLARHHHNSAHHTLDITTASVRDDEARGTLRDTKAIDLESHESKSAYLEQMESARERWDEEATSRISDYFDGERKAMVKMVKSHSGDDFKKALKTTLDKQASKLQKVLLRLYEDVGEDIGSEIAESLNASDEQQEKKSLEAKFTFNIFSAQTVARLLQFAGLRVKQINVTTLGRLQDALAEGVSEGEGIPELAKRIDALYLDSIIPNRSKVVARTEVVSASNRTAFEAGLAFQEDTGQKLNKVWLATGGPRTRPHHAEADGQEVPIDEPFVVGGVEMDHPGSDGPAAEVCNCRCSLFYRRVKKQESSTDEEKRRNRRVSKDGYRAYMEAVLPV